MYELSAKKIEKKICIYKNLNFIDFGYNCLFKKNVIFFYLKYGVMITYLSFNFFFLIKFI